MRWWQRDGSMGWPGTGFSHRAGGGNVFGSYQRWFSANLHLIAKSASCSPRQPVFQRLTVVAQGHPFDHNHWAAGGNSQRGGQRRSEEHTSELQSLMRHSYAVFCLKKKNKKNK